ncbi:MAG: hypothetical protein LUM44_24720 [Pyrinomonadaceae bacterium]|nr:hypothetical protein [Pyrinomonadaceae bacterium]
MIYLQSISEDVNAENYLHGRMENLLGNFPEDQRKMLIQGFANPSADGIMPHFVLADEVAGASVEMTSAKKMIAEALPLADGEEIESEELFTLMTNRSEPQAALLFLRQKTNLAQIFINVPGKFAVTEQITANEDEFAPTLADDSDALVAAVPVWALALAKELGQKLLSMIGTAIWDKVRKDVLKQTDLPSYFEQVYAEIRTIVASAFQENYIKEVKDLAFKFAQTIDYYNNMGKKETDFLIVKDTSFDLITKSNALGSAGAFHYAEATILHIMTLQEGYRRLADEGANPEDLAKAKKYIAETAAEFALNVRAKRKTLLDERMATISSAPFAYFKDTSSPLPGRKIAGVREGAHDPDGSFVYACAPVQNMFRDETTGFWNSMYFHLFVEAFEDFKHSWKWVNNNLQNYRQAIENQTSEELKPLLNVADRLDNLAKPTSLS